MLRKPRNFTKNPKVKICTQYFVDTSDYSVWWFQSSWHFELCPQWYSRATWKIITWKTTTLQILSPGVSTNFDECAFVIFETSFGIIPSQKLMKGWSAEGNYGCDKGQKKLKIKHLVLSRGGSIYFLVTSFARLLLHRRNRSKLPLFSPILLKTELL